MLSARQAGALVAGGALVLAAAAPAHAASPGPDRRSAAAGAATDPAKLAGKLAGAVKVDDINRHLVALQRIATMNGGTRAASTPGHLASAQYIADRLTAAGYAVKIQEFQFPFEQTLAEQGREVSPTARTLNPHVMRYSPNTPVGGVTAALTALPGLAADATPGCEAGDFTGTYTGTIVLIQRGACTFQQKHDNAAAAGAIGVLVYNNAESPTEALSGRLTDDTSGRIPIGGLTRAEGETLAADVAAGPVTVSLELRVQRETRTTRNVIAETRTGRADNVVMSGAHLDSVLEGPGINDNGSGSAAQLEIALRLANEKVRNKVRFAWWSAEEFGLLGSAHYVSQLTFEQQLDIALYLNFDMVASPNYGRFIYDGDDSDAEGAGPGPYGSAQIEDVFEGYFDGKGLAHEGTDFTGRSDYGAFIAAAIPAGGLFTGAEGRKTAEQAARYGGTAGEPYDACYHQACDTLGNVNRTVLAQNAGAMAWAIGTFATDTSTVNGNGSAVARQSRRQAATSATLTAARVPAGAHEHDDAA
ncbi:M28 family metallopeptidase [Planosporangium sp. 12N6]|uniref:M28 family metallopeptidase n=1 Tax=Planosporangium spinosum TaxID=3402278 RepID=UPI003CE7B371